jgi:CRP/FNR family transcriptional regulator, anaerobic regulatory protein
MEINENFFRQYGLSESDWNFTMRSFIPLNVKANDYFLKQGSISDKIGFVKAGVLRSFFHDDNANEVTTQFFQTGSLVISVDSFNNQIPSKENIIAADDTQLFIISYLKLKELYMSIPVWQQICKDIADVKSKDLIERSVEFQTLSATERYRQFCLQYPEVVKKTALRHIASYLGIDIATLSRIRKKN